MNRPSIDKAQAPARRMALCIVLGLTAALTLLAGCEAGEAANAAAGNGGAARMKIDPAVLVEVVQAQKGESFEVQGDYAGEFVAERMAEVAFEVSGRVVSLNFEIGDTVKKDQVLARIDATIYNQKAREAAAAVKMAEAGIGEAEVALENLESNLRRKRPLLDQQLISEREIEDLDAQLRQASQKVLVAQATLEQSRARLQSAREDVRNTEVRAPFDARVAERRVELGSYVGPNQPAFSLVSAEGLYLRINVPEQDAGHVAPGTPVTVRVGALGGEAFDGKVVRVAPALDRATRMLRADIVLDASDARPPELARLRPGMYAQVQVELGRREDAVTIPRQTLLEARSRAPYVWVVKGDQAHKQELVLGLQGRDRVEVVSGLNGGEQVVLRGGETLTEGAKTRLLDTNPGSAKPAKPAPPESTPGGAKP